MSATPEISRRLTVVDIAKLHADGERIPMLTAYDYPTARLLDEAGIPLLLVGDSVGRVILGYENEIPVSMADMLHHVRAVTRGAKHALVVADMPFMSYATNESALANAGRLLADGGAQAVKLEGGVRSARTVRADRARRHSRDGPHRPDAAGDQLDRQASACRARRKTRRARLLGDALALQQAGAFAIVLELVPATAGRGDHRAIAHPDDRHRRRCRVLRPGPGAHRPAGCRCLAAPPRAPIREPAQRDPRRGVAVRIRRGRGHVPGRRRDGAHGRHGPGRRARPHRHGSRGAVPCSRGSRSTATSRSRVRRPGGPARRKQSSVWSSTMPVACMNA